MAPTTIEAPGEDFQTLPDRDMADRPPGFRALTSAPPVPSYGFTCPEWPTVIAQ